MKRKIYLMFILMFTVVTLFVQNQSEVVYAKGEGEILDYPNKAYLLLDYNTNTVLENFNETEKLQVASIVKLMTTLLTLEALEKGEITLDDEVIASQHSASMGGSQAFLDAGQPYKLSELLKSVIVASANDSSVLLAEVVSGSEENFVNMMNDKATALKMYDTQYANATGLPDAGQYSTAKDTAIILKEVMKHPVYFDYSTIWMDDFYHTLDGRSTELTNTNRLSRYYKGCDAGKTGYTDEAGFCLGASAKKGNMRLVAVVLGGNKSKERFWSVTQLFDHGFSNYKNEQVVEHGAEMDEQIKLRGAKEEFAKLTYGEDYYYITKKGSDDKFEVKLELPKNVKAPLKKHDKIGKAYIIKDGNVLEEVEVVAYENYEKQKIKDIVDRIFNNWKIKKQEN